MFSLNDTIHKSKPKDVVSNYNLINRHLKTKIDTSLNVPILRVVNGNKVIFSPKQSNNHKPKKVRKIANTKSKPAVSVPSLKQSLFYTKK